MTPPRFIPFADMTEQEQREHLRDWHGQQQWIAASAGWLVWHTTHHKGRIPRQPALTPHTHDKPARTRTEENT